MVRERPGPGGSEESSELEGERRLTAAERIAAGNAARAAARAELLALENRDILAPDPPTRSERSRLPFGPGSADATADRGSEKREPDETGHDTRRPEQDTGGDDAAPGDGTAGDDVGRERGGRPEGGARLDGDSGPDASAGTEETATDDSGDVGEVDDAGDAGEGSDPGDAGGVVEGAEPVDHLESSGGRIEEPVPGSSPVAIAPFGSSSTAPSDLGQQNASADGSGLPPGGFGGMHSPDQVHTAWRPGDPTTTMPPEVPGIVAPASTAGSGGSAATGSEDGEPSGSRAATRTAAHSTPDRHGAPADVESEPEDEPPASPWTASVSEPARSTGSGEPDGAEEELLRRMTRLLAGRVDDPAGAARTVVEQLAGTGEPQWW